MGQEERNLDILHHLYAEYQKGQVQPIFDLLVADTVWVSEGPVDLPWSGTFKGPAGVRRYLEILAKELRIQSYETREFVAQGDWVVVLATLQLLHKGVNRSETYNKIDIFKMRDGHLVEFHEFYDTAKAVATCRQPGRLGTA